MQNEREPSYKKVKFMNKYRAFGLTLQSDIIFEELMTSDCKEADITIATGRFTNQIKDALIDTPYLKIGRNEYYSDIKNTAKFYVGNGNTMLIEPYEQASPETLKLYILGSCMGAALYQRRILPLHGSSVTVKQQGVLLTGESGAGKSTIAAALYERGGKMLTDDITAIRFDYPSVPMVYPSYPGLKLWDDALGRLNIWKEKKALNRIMEELEKFSVDGRRIFFEHPLPLQTIFEIIPTDAGEISLEEIKGAEKLEVIIHNMYRKLIAEAMDLRQWYFRQCINVAEKTKVYRIKRPINLFLENEIADMILEKIL